MNWDHVRIFLAVARSGQILGAARLLKLNHATVGRQLTALEEALGTRLIDRQNQGCALTAAGEALLVAAEKAESEFLRVNAELSGTAASISGIVRVGAPDGLGNYFLSQELGALAALPLSYAALRGALVYTGAPSWMSAVPDWRVVTFTASMGFIAALLFGFLPTLQMVRAKRGKARGTQIVIGAQVAASCVLLILAGLLVRATLHTLYSNPGFHYEQVLAINPDLGGHGRSLRLPGTRTSAAASAAGSRREGCGRGYAILVRHVRSQGHP